MEELWIVLLILLLIIFLFNMYNQTPISEKFAPIKPFRYNIKPHNLSYGLPNNMNQFGLCNIIPGFLEGVPPEYRRIYTSYPRGVTRCRDLKALMWETRFPGLVDQRYSYNDSVGKRRTVCNSKSLNYESPAKLIDLPVDMRVKYDAQLPAFIALTELPWYPDVSKGPEGKMIILK